MEQAGATGGGGGGLDGSLEPSWVADAVVYQVFPDRFRRSGRVREQAGLTLDPWGSPPSPHGFQGGDLLGLIEGLDHIQSLGATCLLLNPIFQSASNHRYHTDDYLRVDPLLGGEEAFSALLEAVHARGMRLVLDGVFNHCGRGFWPFHHLVENGADSPYRDWFVVERWPIDPYPRSPSDTCGYHCWWNAPALPKFRHAHPPVRDFLLDVARHWLERGIDGWRLDVPDEVESGFWLPFRRMVKAVNPEAWIVGEIWGDARPWLAGDRFDGVMNYRMAWSSLGFFGAETIRSDLAFQAMPYGPLDGAGFLTVVEQTLGWYTAAVNRCQLNLLDSHDVPRALHVLGGDRSALTLALQFLFALPGAPCIYYGTEVGLSGGPEPGCREALPWRPLEQGGAAGAKAAVVVDPELTRLLQELTARRARHPALRGDGWRLRELSDDSGVCWGLWLERWQDGDRLHLVFNRSREERPVPEALLSNLDAETPSRIPAREVLVLPA
ncbi:glycoside hydrolase family 13 protein [Synechococcus sp. RSCCF101]|uniref:glycoside hydrolase family 13 protein n=1 Tax=Synechococcus sp. RSCCF101 TaxID=2511069 RepID=UPI0012450D4F|nr:glycoside hydrolase family 13 protein [Synechococcus sp. RSCCF101]QEY33441.1 glycoside hydrolase family 13 protein [Synechococcus sp. RSCCF101]